ncbi:MAG TPA: alpha-ribazole phosphatase [Bacillota bacterium]|nr:alpha-ribazole phosphatase [Bacillota bacterium]
METKWVYLIRHGKIAWDDGQRSYIGQLDIPLSEEGRKQVRQLNARMSKIKLDAILCSDLSRSLDSAAPIAESHGLVVQVCPDLREISMGDWEGLTFAEVARRFPKEFKLRGMDIGYFYPPHGESFAQCSTRVVAAFHRIVESPAENIAIITHAGVNRVLLCYLLGMPLANLFRITQDYACINVIAVGDFGFRVKRLNAVSQC